MGNVIKMAILDIERKYCGDWPARLAWGWLQCECEQL